MSLHLVTHPLPRAWDGRRVEWDRWEATKAIQICPPPEDERCGCCGSTVSPFTARGLRHPAPETVSELEKVPRIGRRTPLVWPVYDLHAFRCPDCGEVEVWDMATDQRWTLDESDYGPDGSWEEQAMPRGRKLTDCDHDWVHTARAVQCSKCHAFDGDWEIEVQR